jgi:phospholipid/cholesterol/gamma-HCH transport system substrate-binding protein
MRDPSPSQLACLGVIAVVLVAGLTSVLLAFGRGEYADRYEIYATFDSSSQGVFTDGATDVKFRGVRIGSVRGAQLLDDGSVRMELAIDAGVAIPVTTEARLSPLSVFGPKYVELLPGSGDGVGPYLAAGGEVASTSVRPELTDVLEGAGGLVAAADPDDVAAIIDALADASAGRGDEVAAALDGASVLAGIASEDRALLATFLPDVRTIASTVASRNAGFLDRLATYRSLAQLVVDQAPNLESAFDASTRLAERMEQLVRDAATDFDTTVRAAAIVLAGIYEDRALLPSALDTVGAFFDMLGAGMRLPGPDGKNLTALKGFITADLCLVFGVCLLPDGGITAPTSATVGTTTTGAPTADQLGLLPLVDALLQPVVGTS